jgi:demethylmenaquinone methyltransferase/2-methoxy-6-polyprenyl-1,4-benzoquinol methylase
VTNPTEKTHFGFQEVDQSSKAGLVQGIFTSVAGKYDLMNDVMSGGIHRLWKESMIDWLLPRQGQQFLDVAGGTGDIAFRIADRLAAQKGLADDTVKESEIYVCDLTPSMLEEGAKRAENGRYAVHKNKLHWVCGNAQTLPLPDKSVDAYTIAFGLRNVTVPLDALKDAYRVLKPGGRMLCLEFSHVALPLLDKIYDRYSFDILPTLGGIIANDKASYQYLVESIRQFPKQDKLADMYREAGFGQVSYRNLSGGIAAIHSGWRI